MSGTDFTGFKIGVQANPVGRLKLGLAYRTPITVDLSGKTKVMDAATGATVAEMDVRPGAKRGQAAGGRNLRMDRGRAPHLARLRTAVLQPLPRHRGGLGRREHDHTPQHFSDNNIIRLGGELACGPICRSGWALASSMTFATTPMSTRGRGSARAHVSDQRRRRLGDHAHARPRFLVHADAQQRHPGRRRPRPDRSPGKYSVTTQTFALNLGYHR